MSVSQNLDKVLFKKKKIPAQARTTLIVVYAHLHINADAFKARYIMYTEVFPMYYEVYRLLRASTREYI